MTASNAEAADSPPRTGRRLTARVSELVPRGIFGDSSERGLRRNRLERLGVRRSITSSAPVWALAGLLLLAAGSAAVGAATHSLSMQTAVGLAAAVLTVAGLFVAVLQWRLGLSEKAFDALFDRIRLANEMRLDAFKGLDSGDDEAAAKISSERYRFFVFTEIDSLEHAVQRYRLGLGMSAVIVDRAVRHFQIRCGSETFRRTALACVGGSAYFPETKCMVEAIVRRAEDDANGEPDLDERGNPIYPTWDQDAQRWVYSHRERACPSGREAMPSAAGRLTARHA